MLVGQACCSPRFERFFLRKVCRMSNTVARTKAVNVRSARVSFEKLASGILDAIKQNKAAIKAGKEMPVSLEMVAEKIGRLNGPDGKLTTGEARSKKLDAFEQRVKNLMKDDATYAVGIEKYMFWAETASGSRTNDKAAVLAKASASLADILGDDLEETSEPEADATE